MIYIINEFNRFGELYYSTIYMDNEIIFIFITNNIICLVKLIVIC